MKTSVVMTTYNGANYIKDQMDSLRLQTRVPDEVIILDDCSNDSTLDIIRNYIRQYRLAHWRLESNEENQGWRCNFMNGFLMASGEIIFPCDQDDIWNLDKIEMMMKVFEEKSEVLVLVSNFKVLNMSDEKVIRGVYPDVNDGSVSKVKFDKRFMHIRRPGCVFAFRASMMGDLKSVWSAHQAHDSLLWRMGAIKDGLYHYHAETIQWRRHNTSATLGSRDSWAERKLAYESWLEQCEGMLLILNQTAHADIKEYMFKRKIVEAYINMVNLIFEYKKNRRIIYLLKLLCMMPYFPTNRGAFKEVYLLINKR